LGEGGVWWGERGDYIIQNKNLGKFPKILLISSSQEI